MKKREVHASICIGAHVGFEWFSAVTQWQRSRLDRAMATDEGTSVASNGPLGTSKDRDPPPAFDGTNPDALKQYLRDLAQWRWETDIPKLKHAVKVIRQLSGSARAAADEVSIEQLQSEDGIELVIKKLKEHFQLHLEAAMPKAFESFEKAV